jgi:peptidoglycan/LPS O-acetylase OafA/YrhL
LATRRTARYCSACLQVLTGQQSLLTFEAVQTVRPDSDKSRHALAFLPRAEALRGVAALCVLAFHTAPSSGFEMNATGMAPVVVFFVLSGFVLAKSLDRDPTVTTFLRHRAFRLLPAAIATIALLKLLNWCFGMYIGYEPSFDPLNLVLNALLIKSDINGPMWSLTVEVAAIPVILIAHRLFHSNGYLPLVVAIVILFGLSFYGPYVHALGGFTNLGPLYSFVIGMLVHFYQSAIHRKVVSLSATQVAEAVALILIVVAGCRKQTAYTILVEAISAATLLALVASTERRTVLGIALDTPVVRFLGKISYSFFLLHMIGLWIAGYLIKGLPPLPTVLSHFTVAVVITVPIAWLFWRYIEMPFIRLGKNASARAPRSAAA